MIDKGIADGVTKDQLMVLGISWPPRKGWKKRLIGTEIDELAYARFLSLKKTKQQKRKKRKQKKYGLFNDTFLKSYAWRKLRYEVIQKYERRCMCCGLTPDDGIKLHVDHIKPRKRYPELALDINNLQMLCEVCNHGKGNWDETDHRPIAGNT